MGDCHLSPKKHRSLRNANQYVLSKKWLKICSANTKMAISNLKGNVYLTKLSPTAHKHLCLWPWSLSGLWETFIDFYLISYCQNTPRLTQLLNTFDAARKIFDKNVCNLTEQAVTACRKLYNHNHFKMSQLTQCRESSTLRAPLKTACSEETGQLLNTGLFSLLRHP